VVATDTVTMSGLTVNPQGFGAVEVSSLSGPNAGLLGLGFPANSASGATPFFINLAQGGKLASNIFSFFLARHGASGSELCFGCMDSAKFTGNTSFFPLDPAATNGTQAYWNIASSGLSYNGATPSVPIGAVIDSGTTLIYVPTAAAEAFYSQISGAGQAPAEVGEGFYTLPCSTMENGLGTVAFVFGGQSFAVNPSDFNLGPVDETGETCVAGIAASDDAGGLSILGDEFLKNWYSVFDLGNLRVGFAQANQPASSTS